MDGYGLDWDALDAALARQDSKVMLLTNPHNPTGKVFSGDELGRIVLPIELRRTLGIEEKDRIEIFVDGESIILRKYQPACIFCDNAKDIINYKGKNICPDCIRAMNEKL